MIDVQEAVDTLEAMIQERDAALTKEWRKITQHIARGMPEPSVGEATVDGTQLWSNAGGSGKPEMGGRFSSFAQNVSSQAAAVLAGHLIADVWHTLRFKHDALNEIDGAQDWLEEMTDLLFAQRSRPQAAFAESMQDTLKSGLDFGLTPMRVYEDEGHLAYHAPFATCSYVRQDGRERVTAAAYSFCLTAKQAVRDYGDKVAKDMQAEAKDPKKNDPYTFYYLCMRHRGVYWHGHIDKKNKIILWGDTEPNPTFIVGRMQRGKNAYGYSPGRMVIKDVELLQILEAQLFKTTQMMGDPPYMTAGELKPEQAPSLRPGKILSGLVGLDGRPSVVPLNSASVPQASIGQIERLHKAIEQTYFADMLSQAEQIPNATATAVAALEQAKRMRISAVASRMESELFSPLINAEIQILQKMDYARQVKGIKPFLPNVPETVLIAAQEMGVSPSVRVEYTGFLKRSARQRKAQAVQEFTQHVATIAQIDPSSLQRFDADAALKQLSESSDVPASVIRDDQEVERRVRQQRMAEAQARAQAEAEMQMQQEAAQ